MTPADRSVGLGTGGRCCYLGSKCELRLGICVGFRLFNVAPETTARFSYLDHRSRSLSPPGLAQPTPARSDRSSRGRRHPRRRHLNAGGGPGRQVVPTGRSGPRAQRRCSLTARWSSREASRSAMAWRLS
jgi:hypothetical protein